jgi:hypothetical protein
VWIFQDGHLGAFGTTATGTLVVNTPVVPVCDVVMLIHPIPTRGEPTEVIPESAGSAKTSAAGAVVTPSPRPTSVSSADFPVNGVPVRPPCG